MKNKKLVALLLALTATAAIGAFAGCGDNGSDDPNNQIEQTEFTVTFDSKGGTAVAEQGVFGNGKIIDPGAPTKFGYNFVGWYKNDACTEKWNFDTDLVKGHTTLYALWAVKDATADTYFDFTALDDETYAIAVKTGQSLPADTVLPSVHEGKAVTAIADGAFEGQKAVKSVLIPDSVKSVGSRAFRNCTNLERILGAENVEEIGGTAFGGTAYDGNLTGGMVYIGKTLYKYAGGMYTDTELEVRAGTLSIAASAFSGMEKLTGIELPASLKTIGNYAFGSATAGKGAGLKTIEIPDGVVSIGDNAFRNCAALTSATLGEGVESIGTGAFRDCKKLATANIGKNVKDIGARAFAGTAVSSLTYNASATLGDAIFENVTVDGSLILGDDVEEVPMNLVNGWSGLTSITLGAKITAIPAEAFKDLSKLTEIVAPNVTSIGSNAFAGTAITEFTVSEKVETLEANVFAGCPQLKKVIFNSNIVKGIGSGTKAFSGSETLTEIVIGENVESIPAYLFYNTANITKVTFGANVKEIGNSAFYGCTGITGEFTVPDSVETIGDNTFGNMGITKLTVGKGLKTYGTQPFVIGSLTEVVWNAVSAAHSYEETYSSSVSSPFKVNTLTSITFGNQVQIIPASLCGGTYKGSAQKNLTSVSIPQSVKEIHQNAFRFCEGLTSVTGLEGVKNIAANAFSDTPYYSAHIVTSETQPGLMFIYNNKTLFTVVGDVAANTTITVPAGTEIIADSAFDSLTSANKNNITGVTLPEGLVEIGSFAFNGCSKIAGTLSLPASLKKVGAKAFYNCSGITGLDLSKCTALEYIGASSFYQVTKNATEAYDLVLPASLQYLGESAFSGNKIGTIDLTKTTLTEIKNQVFRNVSPTSIKLPSTVTKLGGSWAGLSECTKLEAPGVVEVGASGLARLKDTTFDFSKIKSFGASALVGISVENLTLSADVLGNSLFGSVTIDNGSGAVKSCSGTETLKSITLTGNVKKIGNQAFAGCTGLTSVTLPASCTDIGDFAFYNCAALTGFDFANIEKIGTRAFAMSGLTAAAFGENLSQIDPYAFNGAHLTGELVVGQKLSTIGDYAFDGNKELTKVTVKGTVASIGVNVFQNCTGLTEYIIEEGVKSIGVTRTLGAKTVVTVPSTLTTFAAYAMNVNIVRFPKYFDMPQDFAGFNPYGGTFLSSTVVICESAEDVQKFRANEKLTDADRERYIVKSGIVKEDWFINDAGKLLKYTGTEITNIVLPKEVKSFAITTILGTTAEKLQGVQSFALETGSELYKDTAGAIYSKDKSTLLYYPVYAAATSYTTDTACTAIDAYAFYGNTAITSLTLTNVLTVGGNAFRNCINLATVDLSKVTDVGTYAFASTALASVNLEKVVTIGTYAFNKCTSLHTVTIGADCTSVGTQAFAGGDTTMEVTIKATTPPTVTTSSFGTKAAFQGKIFVPAACVEAYRTDTASKWSTYAEKVEAIPTVTE